MLAVLEILDVTILAAIIGLIANLSGVRRSQSAARICQQRLERKVDVILEHLGIQSSELQVGSDLSVEVRELADKGEKIAAIKRHRELTGCGLKEAKEAVEAYLDR